MRKRHLFIAVATGTLAAGIAAPAYALPGDTPATITLNAGSMVLSVPSASANLGSRTNTAAGGSIAGPLGQIVVDDARTANPGWTASVIATAFTPGAGPAIPASAISYTAGTITKVGTATYTPTDQTDLTGVKAVVTATAITGTNSATWTPTITVAVPGAMAANTYTATITHSVL
jgi:hypothetical protein